MQESVNSEEFLAHTSLIIMVEVIDLCLQIYFIIHYCYIHRRKLFRSARRNPLDGSIMDFDPDYDIEQPNYINRYPPELTFY